MFFSNTISRYLGRQYLIWFLSVLFVFIFIVGVFDIVELLRRGSGKADVTLGIILQMSALKMPILIQDLTPFVVLLSTMMAFWRMAKANELIVARAAGLSAWQIVAPVLIIAFLVGVFQIAVINPFAATLNAQFEKIETQYLRQQKSQLALARTGFWLRQGGLTETAVIHAETVTGDALTLTDVMVLRLDEQERLIERLDAAKGQLQSGYWELSDVIISAADGRSQNADIYRLTTDLTFDKVRESFASADTVSIWELPAFIQTLQDAGFSALEHRLRFHSLLSTPLLLCAMVLVASLFSLRANQRTGAAFMIVGGIVCGFVFFFASKIVHALGLSTGVPVLFAAWIPAGVMTMLGVTALLHLEDG